MRGDKDNAAVFDYIWSNFGENAVENMVDHTRGAQHQQILHLYPSWLTEEESTMQR